MTQYLSFKMQAHKVNQAVPVKMVALEALV